MPKVWRKTAALLGAITTVVAGTVGVISYVKALADDSANAYFVPLQTDLSQHKTNDERWHKAQEDRLDRIEQKIDRLIDRSK